MGQNRQDNPTGSHTGRFRKDLARYLKPSPFETGGRLLGVALWACIGFLGSRYVSTPYRMRSTIFPNNPNGSMTAGTNPHLRTLRSLRTESVLLQNYFKVRTFFNHLTFNAIKSDNQKRSLPFLFRREGCSSVIPSSSSMEHWLCHESDERVRRCRVNRT